MNETKKIRGGKQLSDNERRTLAGYTQLIRPYYYKVVEELDKKRDIIYDLYDGKILTDEEFKEINDFNEISRDAYYNDIYEVVYNKKISAGDLKNINSTPINSHFQNVQMIVRTYLSYKIFGHLQAEVDTYRSELFTKDLLLEERNRTLVECILELAESEHRNAGLRANALGAPAFVALPPAIDNTVELQQKLEELKNNSDKIIEKLTEQLAASHVHLVELEISKLDYAAQLTSAEINYNQRIEELRAQLEESNEALEAALAEARAAEAALAAGALAPAPAVIPENNELETQLAAAQIKLVELEISKLDYAAQLTSAEINYKQIIEELRAELATAQAALAAPAALAPAPAVIPENNELETQLAAAQIKLVELEISKLDYAAQLTSAEINYNQRIEELERALAEALAAPVAPAPVVIPENNELETQLAAAQIKLVELEISKLDYAAQLTSAEIKYKQIIEDLRAELAVAQAALAVAQAALAAAQAALAPVAPAPAVIPENNELETQLAAAHIKLVELEISKLDYAAQLTSAEINYNQRIEELGAELATAQAALAAAQAALAIPAPAPVVIPENNELETQLAAAHIKLVELEISNIHYAAQLTSAEINYNQIIEELRAELAIEQAAHAAALAAPVMAAPAIVAPAIAPALAAPAIVAPAPAIAAPAIAPLAPAIAAPAPGEQITKEIIIRYNISKELEIIVKLMNEDYIKNKQTIINSLNTIIQFSKELKTNIDIPELMITNGLPDINDTISKLYKVLENNI